MMILIPFMATMGKCIFQNALIQELFYYVIKYMSVIRCFIMKLRFFLLEN
jgi:hypothetical protein